METPLHEEPQVQDRASREAGGVGPFAAIVIVIILLLLGGIYFLIERANKIPPQGLPAVEQVNS